MIGLVCFVSALVCVSRAQEVHFGPCVNFTTQPDFDVKKFLGGWYDIEKTYFAGQMDKSCVMAVYSPSEEDNKINVLNQDIKPDTHEENTTGIAYYKDPNVKSKLTVRLGTSPEANYWVVETDYHTYALIWSCAELEGFAHADIGWILGRKQSLDEALIARLKRKLSSLGLQYKQFYKTSQPDTCPW